MSPWAIAPLRTPELMDDPALAAADHLHALDALGTINAISRTAARLAAAVRRVAEARGSGPLHVIDVACGGGDVTLALARRLGSAAQVTGIDVSDRAVARARHVAAASGLASAAFEQRDVVAEGCPPCDVVVTSLFLHHLDDPVAMRCSRRSATRPASASSSRISSAAVPDCGSRSSARGCSPRRGSLESTGRCRCMRPARSPSIARCVRPRAWTPRGCDAPGPSGC
jgi:SAM-dependent methyltransferase